MQEAFCRTISLIGEENFNKIKNSSVIVFGAGGVGSFVIEALARAGVGKITVVDSDTIDISNINRQLYALNSTIGKPKAQLAAERIADINPECIVTPICEFYSEDNPIELEYDYIVDAIDSTKSKVFLIKNAHEKGVPIISSMGTGNKLNPSLLKICDLAKTEYCPLAKKMRYELKKHGITHTKVLYSTETPACKAHPPASISFVPSAAGLLIASEVIADLTK